LRYHKAQFTSDTVSGGAELLLFPAVNYTSDDTYELDFTTSVLSSWYKEKLPEHSGKIKVRFAELWRRQENWDEQEAAKPCPKSLSKATAILEELLDVTASNGREWIHPFITTDEDGKVEVLWKRGRHELHIDVEDEEVEYLKVWGANIFDSMSSDFLKSDEYLTLWDWLLRG